VTPPLGEVSVDVLDFSKPKITLRHKRKSSWFKAVDFILKGAGKDGR
jgi:hypothetical protein